MAVIHTKTKGGLVAVIFLLIVAMAAPFIGTIGFGGFIAVVLISAVILIPIMITLNSGGTANAYKKAVEKSTGIEKVRLKIRSKSTGFVLKLKNSESDYSLSSTKTVAAMAYIHLVDVFYGLLKKDYESSGRGEIFNRISESIVSDETKESIISSRAFGIALGIVIKGAAGAERKKINKVTIKAFIDSCGLDDIYKKELLKTMTTYFNLKDYNTKVSSRTFEELTYALFDAKIKRDKNDIADPVVIMPIKTAILYACENIQIDSSVIKELEKKGFIA